MATRPRLAAALDLCMRLLLAVLALGVIAMTVGSTKASAAGGISRGVQNVAFVHSSSPDGSAGSSRECDHPPSGAYVSIRYSSTISATTRHARLRISNDRRELPLIADAIFAKPHSRDSNHNLNGQVEAHERVAMDFCVPA
jgi:hypothetical protein